MERLFDSIMDEFKLRDAENAALFSEKPNITRQIEPSSVCVTVSEDGLEATIRVDSEDESGSYPVSTLEQAIADSGVCFGVTPAVIMEMAAEGICGESRVFAHGIAPTGGKDGQLIELFPKNKLSIVAEGTKLCEIIKPERGKNGIDVYGQVILAERGRQYRLPADTNTRADSNKTCLFAAISGLVTEENGKYAVSDEYVTDEVKKGEKIDFFGNITVRGNVYEGAEISCGKTLTVGGSVNGAKLIAERVVVSGECKNSRLNAEGMELSDCSDCTIDAAVLLKCGALENCTTVSSGEIICGEILGGETDCAGRISCKRVDSEEHAFTELVLGNVQRLKSDIEKLKKLLAKAADDIEKIGEKRVEMPENAEILRFYEQRKSEEHRISARLEQAEAAIEAAAGSTLRVSDRLSKGVLITHGEFRRNIEREYGAVTVYANNFGVVIG